MTTTMKWCFVLLLNVLVFEVVRGNERDLFAALFTDYNNEVRPRNDSTQPVEVLVDLELMNIKDLEEANEILHIVAFFALEWTDDFLTWEPAAYSGLESLVVHPYRVWLPDMGILNSADTFYHDSFDEDFRVYINYTGKVIWSFGGNLAIICELDMTYFPLDKQTCSVRVENWAYNAQQVTLHNKSAGIDKVNFKDNGIWHLSDTDVSTYNVYYEHAPGVPHTVLSYGMRLERKDMYFIVTLLVPCILLMLVAQSVFWLPAESGEKVSLGVTILLSFSVMALVINDSTPKTSDYYPMLSIYVTILMTMSTVSTITAVCVLYMHHHSTNYRPPAIVRLVAFNFLARVFCMRKKVPQHAQVEPDDEKASLNRPGSGKADAEIEDVEGPPAHREKKVGNGDVASILQELRMFTQSSKDKDKADAILQEWKLVGILIDRCLFVLTTIVIFAGTLATFV